MTEALPPTKDMPLLLAFIDNDMIMIEREDANCVRIWRLLDGHGGANSWLYLDDSGWEAASYISEAFSQSVIEGVLALLNAGKAPPPPPPPSLADMNIIHDEGPEPEPEEEP